MQTPLAWSARQATRAALLLICAAPIVATGEAAEIKTGGFSFSDELGGFHILSATGSGSVADPFLVTEEILEVEPVTLVIRRLQPTGEDGAGGYSAMNLVKIVTNRSNRVWAGFEMELQEVLHKPSTYTDGLSFDQIGERADDIQSDAFAQNRRQYEPDDRIRFEKGHIDPNSTGTFRVTITDPTPTPVFYLVQDPQLLSASLLGSPGRVASSVHYGGTARPGHRSF